MDKGLRLKMRVSVEARVECAVCLGEQTIPSAHVPTEKSKLEGKRRGGEVWRHYMTEQLLSLSPLTFLTWRATRAASVKASLTPLFFIAEHSVCDLVSTKRRAVESASAFVLQMMYVCTHT